MSARSLTLWLLSATLVGSLMLSTSAAAKPPTVPLNQRNTSAAAAPADVDGEVQMSLELLPPDEDADEVEDADEEQTVDHENTTAERSRLVKLLTGDVPMLRVTLAHRVDQAKSVVVSVTAFGLDISRGGETTPVTVPYCPSAGVARLADALWTTSMLCFGAVPDADEPNPTTEVLEFMPEEVEPKVEVLEVMPTESPAIEILTFKPTEVVPSGEQEAAPPATEDVDEVTDPVEPTPSPVEKLEVPPTPSAPQAAAEATCPYLRAKSAPQAAVVDVPSESVLSNLRKLLRAKKLYHKAERLRDSGDAESAQCYYQAVQYVCPGSRYDHLAAEQLEILQAHAPVVVEVDERHAVIRTSTSEATTEEQEEIPQLHRKHRAVEQKPAVCPCSNNAKHTDDQSRLDTSADKTMNTSACPAGCPAACCKNGSCKGDCYPECKKYAPKPGCATDCCEEAEPISSKEPKPEPQSQLLPKLPAVDPKVVDALESILAASTNPAIPKLVMQVLSAKDDAEPTEESAEEAEPAWPTTAPAVDMPSLFAVPPADPSESEEQSADEADDDDNDDPQAELSTHDLHEALRDTLDALQSRAWIEVDASKLGQLRSRYELQLGGVDFALVVDSAGQGYVTVRKSPVSAWSEAAESSWLTRLQAATDSSFQIGSADEEAEPFDLNEDDDADEDTI